MINRVAGLAVLLGMSLGGCAIWEGFEGEEEASLPQEAVTNLPSNHFPRTTLLDLDDVQREAFERKPASKGAAFNTERPSGTVEATYTGKSRKVNAETKHFLSAYAKMVDDRKVLPLYAHEILVEELGHRYWLPVQSEVFAYLKKNLAKQQKALFKVRHMGFVKPNQSVFIVIDYDSLSKS